MGVRLIGFRLGVGRGARGCCLRCVCGGVSCFSFRCMFDCSSVWVGCVGLVGWFLLVVVVLGVVVGGILKTDHTCRFASSADRGSLMVSKREVPNPRKANWNMSNIKTTLKNTITKKANQPRTVKDWYNKLDEEDQTAIAEALISGDVSATEMHRILKNLETNPIPFEVTAFKDFARKLKETK